MLKLVAFRRIVVILMSVNLIGCTSLQSIEAQPEDLPGRIRSEHILKVDDEIRISTQDGKEYQLRVTSVDDTSVHGDGITIPIDSITTLETEKISGGKTALLFGGIGSITLLVLLVIIAPVIFLAPG